MTSQNKDLAHRFGYHPPRSRNRVKEHETVRKVLEDTADHLLMFLPEGRETSLVLTKLEEAMFWGNAALARSADPDAEVSAEEAAAGPQ